MLSYWVYNRNQKWHHCKYSKMLCRLCLTWMVPIERDSDDIEPRKLKFICIDNAHSTTVYWKTGAVGCVREKRRGRSASSIELQLLDRLLLKWLRLTFVPPTVMKSLYKQWWEVCTWNEWTCSECAVAPCQVWRLQRGHHTLYIEELMNVQVCPAEITRDSVNTVSYCWFKNCCFLHWILFYLFTCISLFNYYLFCTYMLQWMHVRA